MRVRPSWSRSNSRDRPASVARESARGGDHAARHALQLVAQGRRHLAPFADRLVQELLVTGLLFERLTVAAEVLGADLDEAVFVLQTAPTLDIGRDGLLSARRRGHDLLDVVAGLCR